MYSESDLDNAVAAGAMTAEAAGNFRAFVAGQHTAPAVDEEYVRLLTGFNDIFVSIAVMLVLAAAGTLSWRVEPSLSGVVVAALSWGLSEYFTRERRMALPSILLLLGFVGGFGVVAVRISLFITHFGNGASLQGVNRAELAAVLLLAAAITAAACWGHWRRFKVPITVAAGTASAIGFGLGTLLAIFPGLHVAMNWLTMVCGLGVFALALRWDMSDTTRTTKRSDVAFWLHLLAAPMIVHPVFLALGLLGAGAGVSRAGAAILIYVVLAWVALLVDRRALLVSALGYVLFAITHVFRQAGFIGTDLALTALVVGSALLLLSAYWHKARAIVLRAMPPGITRQLPAV